jgi:hypothetical protein
MMEMPRPAAMAKRRKKDSDDDELVKELNRL